MRLLLALALIVGALVCLIALVALCVRVAGTADAWKVGLMIVVTGPLIGFAARERR